MYDKPQSDIELMTGRLEMGMGKPVVLTLLATVVPPDTVGLLLLWTDALADPLAVVDEELDELAALAELPTLMS